MPLLYIKVQIEQPKGCFFCAFFFICNSVAYVTKLRFEMKTAELSPIVTQNDFLNLNAIQEATAVICQRELSTVLKEEAQKVLQHDAFEGIRQSGNLPALKELLGKELSNYPHLLADTIRLLEQFFETVQPDEVRLGFLPVRNGMCRKFHTDITDFRLLCTYQGAGTDYILPEKVSEHTKDYATIPFESVNTGDVILFRGAAEATDTCPPLLHKSPSVQGEQEHRLLLRLDTNHTVWE